MSVTVNAFSAAARTEFMNGMIEAGDKPYPANYESFTTQFPSSTKVETHVYMSNLPRLHRFKGYSPGVRITDNTYTVTNYTYRIGPVTVSKEDLDDDQVGGYLRQINNIPSRGMKDIGFSVTSFLAAGPSNNCFDGTKFFAASHAYGSGNNLDTYNGAANDGATHKIIALVTNNSSIKPVIFQDRESLSSLMTDADTPEALKKREYEYWADCRYGLGYGYWWDAYQVTITDTPTVGECYEIIRQIINGLRTFTFPKGRAADDTLYIHEGWEPGKSDFVLVCNLKLKEILQTAITIPQYVTSTGNVDNVYKDKATVIAASALGA